MDWADLRARPLASFAVVGVGIAGVFSWGLPSWVWVLEALLVAGVIALWLYAHKGRATTAIDTVSQSVRVTYRALEVTFFRREFRRSAIACVLAGWDDESPALDEAASGSGIHPVTLVLSSGRKWVILQSRDRSAAGGLIVALAEHIGVPSCSGGQESAL